MIDWLKIGAVPEYNYYTGNTATPTTKKKTASTGTTKVADTGTAETIAYPTQWGEASDLYSKLAGGTYTNTGLDYITKLLGAGGTAGKLTDYATAQKSKMMSDYSNAVKELMESAGVGGTRYSSGLQNSIANYGAQLSTNYEADLMDKYLSALNADTSTAQSLGSTLLGGATAGAGGLESIGTNYAYLPMAVSSAMNSLGTSLSSQDTSSWASLLAGLLGGTASTTSPTTGTDIASILAGMDWSTIFGNKDKTTYGDPMGG